MTITYGAMGTAAAGLLLALASRVVLKQLGASGSWNLNSNNAINSFLIIFFLSNDINGFSLYCTTSLLAFIPPVVREITIIN